MRARACQARGPSRRCRRSRGGTRSHRADEGLRTSSKRRERRITDDELDALLTACDSITSSVPLGAIVRFALATSMRRGEILRMRRADVDEAERIVLIRNRKHPTDRDRVDESPLMPAHSLWPRWDALEIIKAQPKGDLIFPYQGDTVGELSRRPARSRSSTASYSTCCGTNR